MPINCVKADIALARKEVAQISASLRAAEKRLADIERSYTSGASLVRATIEIIREQGSRQKIGDLVNALEQRGYRIGGQNKATNLSSSLCRSPKLSPNRTEGWGLREWESSDEAPAQKAEIAEDELPF